MSEDAGPDQRVWRQRFTSLAQATGAIVWCAPPSGRGDDGVSAWAEFTGQPPAEIADEGWAIAIHPDERDTISAQWYRAADAHEPFEATYRVRRHDGVYRSMHLRVVPVVEDGEIVEWVGLAIDETDRLVAEATTRRSAGLLKAAVEGAPIVLLALDADGRFTVCEGRLLRDAGRSGDRLIGASAYDFFADRPDWRDAVRRALAGEAVTWEGRTDDLSLMARLLPLFGDRDEVIGAAGVVVDNTELRRAEDARRESEERYRTLTETSPDFIFAIDSEHRVRYVNARAARSFGRAQDDLVGRPISELFDEKTSTRMAARLTQVFETGETLRAEGTWSGPSGTAWLSTWLVPHLDESGAVREVFGASRDISERKAVEEEIRSLNAELERRIVTRTTELDAVNKELEAFAYSASHDLRAPLRAIDGYSAMVMEDAAGRLTEDDERHLQRVRAAAQRMGQLIDDILGLSRLTRADMQVEDVDLSELAHAVCEELSAENAGRVVEFEVEPGIVVEADPALLRVILRDLLENAWKFTSGHETALVEVGTADVDGDTAVFVRDDGAGFDPRFTKHLFGAFQRMHRADEFEGDGIGLATVQRLVHRHGGRVWAVGEVERGAQFFFTLPRRRRVNRGGRAR